MSRWGVPDREQIRRPPRTTTSYAILGLLSVREWTTYELAKQVQRSLRWFWPRAERKLYDEPKHLVTDGLATAHKQFTGQRPRTVYAITPDGREALQRWLDEPSAAPATEFEALIKVFFADAGSLEQLTAVLDAIEQTAAERIRELCGMAESAVDGGTFPERDHISALSIRLPYLQEAAVLAWCGWAREQTARWAATTDPDGWDPRAALAEMAADGHRLLDRAAPGSAA